METAKTSPGSTHLKQSQRRESGKFVLFSQVKKYVSCSLFYILAHRCTQTLTGKQIKISDLTNRSSSSAYVSNMVSVGFILYDFLRCDVVLQGKEEGVCVSRFLFFSSVHVCMQVRLIVFASIWFCFLLHPNFIIMCVCLLVCSVCAHTCMFVTGMCGCLCL